MKISVLKNFGLGGQDLQAGTTVTVNKSHFGDNEAAFREAGFFEDFAEAEKEADAKPKPARKPKKADEAEAEPTAPEPPAEPEAPAADDPA